MQRFYDVFLWLFSPAETEVELPAPSVQKLSSDLQPLMFWMSNATELLNFFQVKVEAMEKEWEFEGEREISDYSMFSENQKYLYSTMCHIFCCRRVMSFVKINQFSLISNNPILSFLVNLLV